MKKMEKKTDVCTDGAKSMTSSIKGVVSQIKKENSECFNSYYAMLGHQLDSKGTPSDFSSVLDDVIKIINFIESRPLRIRIFFIICKDIGSLHCNLHLHTSVRWLSQSKVLQIVFE